MNLGKIFNFVIDTYNETTNNHRKKVIDYASNELKKQEQLLNQLEKNGDYQKAEKLRNTIEHNESILDEQKSRLY